MSKMQVFSKHIFITKVSFFTEYFDYYIHIANTRYHSFETYVNLLNEENFFLLKNLVQNKKAFTNVCTDSVLVDERNY